MKFISSFQCLMGGNAVQFHESSSSSSLPATKSSSILLLDNNNNNNNNNNDDEKKSSRVVVKKKKKTKKSRKKTTDNRKVIRVFKPDGEINLYKKPIKVSEVVMTNDEYMVCRSDSFYIGQKIPSLSENDRLERGHTYFLLPSHLFHSVLSFVTIASFTSSSKQQQKVDIQHDTHDSVNANMKMKAAFLKKAAASSCSPFDIQKTPSGTLSIRVSELFISQLMMDQAKVADSHQLIDDDEELVDILCTTPQLHREYKQLVVGSRSRCWKPKLEVIKETPPAKGKRKVKLLLSASFSRMKKKMKNNKKDGLPQISSSSKKNNKKNKKNKTIKPEAVSLRPSSSVKPNKFSKNK